jgi:hypothetical protein
MRNLYYTFKLHCYETMNTCIQNANYYDQDKCITGSRVLVTIIFINALRVTVTKNILSLTLILNMQ